MSGPFIVGSSDARAQLASEVQTTIVTLDRDWGQQLAVELREHLMPTLLPASPARWRSQFEGAEPNCVVFDLDHGGDAAIQAIEAIKARSSATMILVAASSPSIKTVVSTMRAGAFDFINKRQSMRLSRQQIQEAADHALAQQGESAEGKEHRSRIDALTPREREILAELANGLATKQIAHQMDLSPRTVEMFRSRIKRRLGASSIAEAVSIWQSHRDRPRLRVVE
jgi:two-component system, LuxR family, response regulator FixJ